MPIDFLSKILEENYADQYFFPAEYAIWEKGIYRLSKPYKPDIGGVRFHEYAPSNPSVERVCQHDLATMVSALSTLRKFPKCEHIILHDFVKGVQNDNQFGRRVKFGLYSPASIKYKNDKVAAKISYRLIRKAISVSGFKLVHPVEIPFNPDNGLEGLREWADHIKLKRKNYWWTLIFLLLPLLFLLKNCGGSETFLGIPINTSSFIIMIDKSTSMEKTLSIVKEKTKKELDKINARNSWFDRNYVDVISYNDGSYTAFGKLEPLNKENIQKLVSFVEKQQAGGGTCVRPAFDQAIKEIKLHNQPTTILLFTDGDDGCLKGMLAPTESDTIKTQLNVKLIVNSATPRLLSDNTENTQPANDFERDMDVFSKAFNGTFGVIK